MCSVKLLGYNDYFKLIYNEKKKIKKKKNRNGYFVNVPVFPTVKFRDWACPTQRRDENFQPETTPEVDHRWSIISRGKVIRHQEEKAHTSRTDTRYAENNQN